MGRPDLVSVSGETAGLIAEFFVVAFESTSTVRNAAEVELHVVKGIRPELLGDPERGLVNAAFRERYEAVFGDECPEAAWRAQDASAALLGEL